MTPRYYKYKIVAVIDLQPILCDKCGKRVWVSHKDHPYLCNEHFIELTASEHPPATGG